MYDKYKSIIIFDLADVRSFSRVIIVSGSSRNIPKVSERFAYPSVDCVLLYVVPVRMALHDRNHVQKVCNRVNSRESYRKFRKVFEAIILGENGCWLIINTNVFFSLQDILRANVVV